MSGGPRLSLSGASVGWPWAQHLCVLAYRISNTPPASCYYYTRIPQRRPRRLRTGACPGSCRVNSVERDRCYFPSVLGKPGGNPGTEGLSGLPKVAQVISSRTRVPTQAFGHRAVTHLPSSLMTTVARTRAGTRHSAVCKAFTHVAPPRLSAQRRPRAHSPHFTEETMETRRG